MTKKSNDRHANGPMDQQCIYTRCSPLVRQLLPPHKSDTYKLMGETSQGDSVAELSRPGEPEKPGITDDSEEGIQQYQQQQGSIYNLMKMNNIWSELIVIIQHFY